MYRELLKVFQNDPKLYETNETPFWDDEYISKSMLEAHLAPEVDGASRNHTFIKKSVDWITSLSTSGKDLLDLGCGPGIYAELFQEKGYQVTGLDFSKRSIDYAKQSAFKQDKKINYVYQDYLKMEYVAAFDVITLIYCDFDVLSEDNRSKLLKNIYTALKPGGIFVLDTFTPAQFTDFEDEIRTTYESSGFWSPEQHLCIKKCKRYENNHFLEQYTIITGDMAQTYYLWKHAFTSGELADELQQAGFETIELYNDISGQPLKEPNQTVCAVVHKG